MSDQYEPSYYEIALTGRQVLVSFVVVLVCLVTAFFSGVWVGRGSSEPVAMTATGDEEGLEEPLEELAFFEEEPLAEQPDLERVAREPRPDTTLLEDLGGDPRNEEPEETVAPPAAAPTPAGTADAPGDDRADESDAGAAGAPPAATRRPAVAPASGDLVIQVLSSSDQAKATEVRDRLRAAGFRAFLSPVVVENRTLYRVRVGPFEREAQARQVAARIESSLDLKTWITQ